jgi:hypothetical protein
MDMVSAAHFGAFGTFGTSFRMRLRDEPGRPELKSRGFHNAITAIYLPGTSGCHSALDPVIDCSDRIGKRIFFSMKRS